MAEIELKGIFKTYNPGLFKKKVNAVRGVSLVIRSGEVFGLIGPNGAGKSTTIRLILNLLRPDTGTIHFRGRALEGSGILREVGYLPENPYLYDHLNLRELLSFCGRVSGLDSLNVRRRRDLLTEKLGLQHVQKRPLGTFSKGMLQRAGICFALLHDPSLVILDEPMSGLDPLGRKMVFDLVMELKGEGKTIFFCSHILSDVERLCDRIGMMAGGRLVRVFENEEFWTGTHGLLHLTVPSITESQRERLNGLVEGIAAERSENVLSVSPQRLAEVVGCLSSLGVPLTGSRSEPFSLEELFLKTLEEQGS